MICLAVQVHAQDSSTPSPIIFIYDASGSMWGQIDGMSKIEIATDVLSTSVNNFPENQNVGLVAYGHRQEGDCRDVEFIVSMDNNDKDLINQTLSEIRPLGRTPLAYSATQVINTLRESEERATVILVTDGIESCDGNICEVVQAAKNEGIDFKLHIIGFGLQGEETTQLQCAAKAGGGQYYDAENAEVLTSVLNQATEATVDEPDGNFSVYAIKNSEPIDAMVEAYQAGTSTRIETARTYRDSTFLYLPPGSYDLKVTPLEASDVNPITVYGIESAEDQIGHQTVSFDGGMIRVFTTKNGEGWDSQVRIFQQDGSSAAAGRTYGEADDYELNPGSYDVEVTAIGLEGAEITHRFEDITIGGGDMKEIQHDFKSGTAKIGINGSFGLVDARIKIIDTATGSVVATGRSYTSESSNPRLFTLTPGTYNVEVEAVEIEGIGRTQTFEGLIVEENKEVASEHLLESGVVLIGATSSGELVDAMVRIVETTTNSPVSAARTYTSESSNPRRFVLSPGSYEVTITGLGEQAGDEQVISITVGAGTTVEQNITF
jgi:Ca-activated chloride channel family protein